MVNRIRELLAHLDLSASRFADHMEIPRSTVSHILSERNKPSLEFIQKLMEKFPEINTEWLLKGKGNMMSHQQDLFSDLEVANQNQARSTASSLPPERTTEKTWVGEEKKDLNLAGESVKEKMHQVPDNEQMMHPENQKKRIVKIITFYQDNTFDEYLPAPDKN